MTFLTKLLILVAIAMILQFTAVFASKIGDKVNRKRIEKLKELNKQLVELNKRHVNEYLSLYDNMVRVSTMSKDIEKENKKLKKELYKQEHVTYNYYINK